MGDLFRCQHFSKRVFSSDHDHPSERLGSKKTRHHLSHGGPLILQRARQHLLPFHGGCFIRNHTFPSERFRSKETRHHLSRNSLFLPPCVLSLTIKTHQPPKPSSQINPEQKNKHSTSSISRTLILFPDEGFGSFRCSSSCGTGGSSREGSDVSRRSSFPNLGAYSTRPAQCHGDPLALTCGLEGDFSGSCDLSRCSRYYVIKYGFNCSKNLVSVDYVRISHAQQLINSIDQFNLNHITVHESTGEVVGFVFEKMK